MTMPMRQSLRTSNRPGPYPSSGGRLVSADGRMLPMRGTQLSAEAHGGIARVLLRQRFVNPYDEPLAVRYQVPLPADGAVSDFAFELGARRIVGEIDKRERARERFEEAIVEGCSAALLEQDRSSLFTQDVGNIPAGEQIVAELVIDQKLRWLTEGRWEWRFPTVVAPRYQGAPGRAEDASKLSVDVAAGELPQRAELMLHIEDALPEGARPESTSHPIAVVDGEVRFRDESGARLDRDVVVSWPVAGDGVRTALSVARPAARKRWRGT
jgi:Ca-activated chloride channel family protein